MLATSIIILASCGGSGNQSNSNTLNIELPLKATSISPYDTDVLVKAGAAETLFKSNTEGEIQKLLVESYQQESLTKLKLKLKKDIEFQNGDKLTGDSVKTSFENSF